MKLVFVLLIALLSVNYSYQDEKMDFMMQILDKCFKKTGCEQARILMIATSEDWSDIDPPVNDAEKCFFICPMGMAMLLKPNKCFNCKRAETMLKMVTKSESLRELGEALIGGLKTCCPTLKEDDCCQQHYDLIRCMMPIVGDKVIDTFIG